MSMYKILGLFFLPCQSHYRAYEPLLRNLAELGHNLTIFTHFPMIDPPKTYHEHLLKIETGQECADIISFNPRQGQLSELLTTWKLFSFSVESCRKFVNNSAGKLDSNESYDAILIEHFVGDCSMGFANRFGSPIVALSVEYPLPWFGDRLSTVDNPSYVPNFYHKSRGNMDFLSRLQNTLSALTYKVLYNVAVQMPEQRILEGHFGSDMPKLKDSAKNTTMLLSNTHFSLNGVYPKNANVVEVGGFHIKQSILNCCLQLVILHHG
ncbi:UDP-glycosyltransferase UGT5-like [Arctopsyche grandis]|uniref:UDP-glycosyltransferase UGT5-like n=1 Tax=Arctopsyche grandis TaxID=121162 RepID=UPI00406DA1B7